MPTFIKTGFWEKLSKGYKGFLNLDDLIRSISGTQSSPAEVVPPTVTVYGNIIPSVNNTYNLGDGESKWKTLHVGEDVIFVDGSVQTTAYIPATTQTFDPLFTDLEGAIAGVTSQGHYTMLSPKVCFFRVKVFFDNCTNFGTTQYQFNLPFPSVETLRTGNATIHRRSDNVYFHIAGIADVTASLSIMKLYYSGSTTDLAWKATTPVGATTTSSHFDISGVYEIA